MLTATEIPVVRERKGKKVADDLSPAQLFWVIKNGINMTGMPSFGLIEVPDQEKKEVLDAFAAHKGEVTEGYV